MLANIYTKTIRDRWVGTTIGVGAISLWLLMGVAVYRDIDLGVYNNLPEYIRALMGIPDGADAAALAVGVIFGFAGAMILASLALTMGSASIAGEEKDGTLGLLLGNPKTRRTVLLSKLAGMVTVIVVGTLVLYAAVLTIPPALGVDVGNLYVEAMMLHLIVNALFYGFLAALIGAWTGERSKASGITVGVMLIGYFAAGLLPLIDSISWLAKAFPWYYFDSSAPDINGVAWGHIAVLGGLSLAFVVAAIWLLDHRDLKLTGERVTIIDRLRENPRTQKIMERLAGGTRVSRIWIKTLSDNQMLLIITSYVMFLMMGLLMGPMYLAIDDTLATFMDAAPDALMALVGNADMGTPEGWYQGETFSIMAPAAVILVTAAIGSRAVAGEEADRTLGLLLANPIRRSTVVVEKTIAMTIAAVIVGLFTYLGVMGGSVIAGLGMSWANVGATTVLVTLLGLVFGAFTLFVGALTGKARIAISVTVGVAFASYLIDGFFALSETLAPWKQASPWHFYLSSNPMIEGFNWMHVGVLAGLFVLLTAAAIVAFDRRDISLTG
jgi:ABC-2 type transport system permease protein